MSLGNDPSRVGPVEEPEPEECLTCHRRTHDPGRLCLDCRHEGVRDHRPETDVEDRPSSPE